MFFCRLVDTVAARYRPRMAEKEQAAVLREKAAKCRRLATGMADEQTVAALLRLAEAYERQAGELDSAAPSDPPAPPPQAD